MAWRAQPVYNAGPQRKPKKMVVGEITVKEQYVGEVTEELVTLYAVDPITIMTHKMPTGMVVVTWKMLKHLKGNWKFAERRHPHWKEG